MKKYTQRSCLQCESTFKSWGIANRLCRRCRETIKWGRLGDERGGTIAKGLIPRGHMPISQLPYYTSSKGIGAIRATY